MNLLKIIFICILSCIFTKQNNNYTNATNKTSHRVFPHIPSKNPNFLFFESKSSSYMFLRQLVKWFFDLCYFRPFFDFLKKCRFADFSTLHKKSLVKFYVFHHGFQTCRWIYKISLASLSSIYGPQFVLSGF